MKPSTNYIKRLKSVFLGLALMLAGYCFYDFSGNPNTVSANSSGPPNPYTNAPGETNCTACHNSFTVNSGTGNVRITGLPNNYRPNQQIPLTATLNQQGAVVFGFQTTAINNAGAQAGDYILPAQTPAQMQTITSAVSGFTRKYVEHTSSGIIPTVFDTKSWSFTWKAPALQSGRVTFYISGNAANSDGSTQGDYIYTNNATICSNSPLNNFDADNKAEIGVFRPSDGIWYRLNSTDNSYQTFRWGTSGDKLTAGDFDGDGKTDFGVFRNGTFYYVRSSNGSAVTFQWGTTGDKPVVADFDGDGKTDIAVYRNGIWYIVNSADGSTRTVQWGIAGDKPIPADFDRDGKADLVVWRPSDGIWYVLQSSNGGFAGTAWGGTSGDKPFTGDFDGDGKADVGVYRNGVWYILRSTAGPLVYQFGISTDLPIPADYDGDCRTDIAVYRNGIWYIVNSSNNSVRIENFGVSSDLPLPNTYLPE